MRTAYILAGAACALADLSAAPKMSKDDGLIVVNRAGVEIGNDPAPVAWCSLLVSNLLRFRNVRRQAKRPDIEKMYVPMSAKTQVHNPPKGIVFTEAMLEGQPNPGSSTMFAIKVALIDLKYDRVILCGAPLLSQAGAGGDVKKPWKDAERFQKVWTPMIPSLKGKVFSMSGWTRDQLGAPDGAKADYSPDFSKPAQPMPATAIKQEKLKPAPEAAPKSDAADLTKS